MLEYSRRELLKLMGAGLLMAHNAAFAADLNNPFRIRTITAGVQLSSAADLKELERAHEFLLQARDRYRSLGYEVQTLRIATQPFTQYCPNWAEDKSLAAFEQLEQFAAGTNLSLSIGPAQLRTEQQPLFAAWAAELMRNTAQISFSLPVAAPGTGVDSGLVYSAAQAVQRIARVFDNGEGNFRFAATAFCPPGTPFFPAAYHSGEPAFSLGLESANLLRDVFIAATDIKDAQQRLRQEMAARLAPLQEAAVQMAAQHGRRYWGIDLSPAPGPDASIGEAIEQLTGTPFGGASTLTACAAITEVLKGLPIQKCGYSGLMLPVLEDKVLAQRAAEQRFGVSELLLYSSVCGTGLDVVPLAGDTPVEVLAAVIGDMAALANKYQKPLSARLLPLPGRRVGEQVSFDNPYLVDSVVMKID